MKKINALFFAMIIAASFMPTPKLSAMENSEAEPSEEWKKFFDLVASNPEKKEKNGRLFIKMSTLTKDENGAQVVSTKWVDVEHLVPKDKDGRCPEPFGVIKHTVVKYHNAEEIAAEKEKK